MENNVSQIMNFLRAQKAVEVFPDGETTSYEMEKLGLTDYVRWAYERYILTLTMLSMAAEGIPKPRILELGALPYLCTGLVLRIHPNAQLFLGGAPSNNPICTQGRVVITNPFLESRTYDLPLTLFNVEKDEFPYPDSTFDVVLCSEILEHLTYSPSHMLYEINRVLKSGEELILTTPNVCSLGKILQLLRYRNVYSPLSKHSIYGRHNREYTPDEVAQLLDDSNFRVVQRLFRNPSIGRNAYSKGLIGLLKYYTAESLYTLTHLRFFNTRGDFILCRAQKIGPPKYAEPTFLYGEASDTRHN